MVTLALTLLFYSWHHLPAERHIPGWASPDTTGAQGFGSWLLFVATLA